MSEANQGLVKQSGRMFSLMPQSLGEAKEIANLIANSDFAPKDYKNKPDNVIVALQMGADLGLKPMQALQNIAVINGRPSIYGDAALALAMEVLEKFTETFTGTFPEDDFTAVCTSKRKGWPDETVRTFSIGDAKKANLWGKAGPWQQYPKRMLQFRARGFNLRDVASDRLLGLILAEEAQDYPAIDGHVVSAETVVTSAPVSLLDQLPEAVRDNIEKAFETLNLAPGMRLAKVNEFMGGDGVDSEAGALQLLDWCKDEYAKRKTGQPRAKKTNGNEKAKKDDEPKTVGSGSTVAAADKTDAAAVPKEPEAVTVPAEVIAATKTTAAPAEDALF